jgi:hypothetical protein
MIKLNGILRRHQNNLHLWEETRTLQRQSHASRRGSRELPCFPTIATARDFHMFASQVRRKCKWFARTLSRLITTANSTPKCDVRYNMVGHITVVAPSVFIHRLVFGTAQNELDAARHQLGLKPSCLVVVQDYWPALGRGWTSSPCNNPETGLRL